MSSSPPSSLLPKQTERDDIGFEFYTFTNSSVALTPPMGDVLSDTAPP